MGWRLRGAASLDGGETFSASEPLADVANNYLTTTQWPTRARIAGVSLPSSWPPSLWVDLSSWLIQPGHTSGLAVDTNGVFHPTWVDHRTGVAQLWTASVHVTGTVVKHGTADLATLDDLSKSVVIDGLSSFDRKTGLLSVTTRLRNKSSDTIEGPLKLRVVTFASEIGIPEITNADNGEKGTGAVWDFSEQLPGGKLAPQQSSATKVLKFHLSDIYPLVPGDRSGYWGLLRLTGRVYGKAGKQ
jgi:hypothetical protein